MDLALIIIVGMLFADAVVAFYLLRKRAALDQSKPEGREQAKKYLVTLYVLLTESVAIILLVWFILRPMLAEA